MNNLIKLLKKFKYYSLAIGLVLVTGGVFATNIVVKNIKLKQSEALAIAPPPSDGTDSPISNIIPPSPNAYELGKYGQIPVGMFTGTANINVPLYTYTSKELSVPISLSYNSNGIKVDQMSTWTGLGWALNAGGVITRIVRDLPDESTETLLPQDDIDYGDITDPMVLDFLHEASQDHIDNEPDLYMFNFMGQSGKFVFNSDHEIVVMPYQPINITQGSNNGDFSFKIKTTDGITYYFGGTGAIEYTRNMSISVGNGPCQSSPESKVPQPTAWYLTKVEHPSGDILEFEYDGETYTYDAGISQNFKIATNTTLTINSINFNCGSCGYTTPQSNTCVNAQRITGKRLRKISSNHSYLDIEFIPKGNTMGDYGGKLLDQIVISEINNSSSIEELNFDYDLNSNDRIFLEKVTHKDPFKKYEFEYIDKENLPARLSYAQDHWGYFNNIINGTYFVPVINSVHFDGIGKDKSPNGNFAQKGLLNKVTYPTGGYNELIYEPNSYWGTERIYPATQNYFATATNDLIAGIETTVTPFTAYDAQSITINASSAIITNIEDGCDGSIGGTGTVRLLNVTDNYYVNLQAVGGSFFVGGTSYNLGGTNSLGVTLKAEIENQKDYQLEVSASQCAEVTASTSGIYTSTPSSTTSNIQTGGLRIQRLITHDPVNNKSEEKVYHYGSMDNYTQSSGNPGPIPFYISNSYNRTQCMAYTTGGLGPHGHFDCAYKTLGSSSLTSLFNTSSNNIYYSNVTVSHGGADFENGGEEHTFVINRDVSAQWVTGEEPISSATHTNSGWNHGLEIESKIFKKDNNSFVVLQKNENSYVVDSTQYKEASGLVFRARYSPIGLLPNTTSYNCTSNDTASSKTRVFWGCTADHEHNFRRKAFFKQKKVVDGIKHKNPNVCVGDTRIEKDAQGNITGTTPVPAQNDIQIILRHKCYGKTLPYTVTYPKIIEHLDIMRYKNISHWFYMNEKKSIVYDENGQNPLETTTYYEYDNPAHAQPTMVKTVNSDGTEHISRTKYAADFDNIDANQWQTYADTETKGLAKLLYDYKITTPIETRQFIKKPNQPEQMLGGSISIFDNFANINNIQPDGNTLPTKAYRFETASGVTNPTECSVDANGNFIKDQHYRLAGTIQNYDNEGNLLCYKKEKDIPTSIIWGYNQTLPIAKVVNATPNDVAYTSFETMNHQGGWSYSMYGLIMSNPKTGQYAYDVNSGNITKILDSGTFTLSLWATSPNITISVNGIVTNNLTSDGYNEIVINNINNIRNTLSISGTGTIDELRLYPKDALMSTYTYNPVTRQLLNITDENNMTASFKYDQFQRLSQVFDHEGNLVSYNEYNYQDPNSNGNDQYNWVKNTAILTSGKTVANIPTLDVKYKQQNVQYFDGLGRPIQTVAVKQSATKRDIVQYIEYDDYGRMEKSYLPFTAASLNGNFHLNALTQQEIFYANKFSGTTVGNSTAFSETVFDGSPLNRPVEQGGPGFDWQIGNGHTMTTEFATNTNADAVRDYSRNVLYGTGQLIKQKVVDENGVPTWSFTDKLGRTILTRRRHTKDNGTIEYAETYTVYDDFGNVKTVIPPLAAKILKDANTYSLTNVQDLIYKYRYDSRQRLIEKKIPSAASQLFVYDALDRIVLTQDGNLRQNNKWQFTKYDILNRPVMSGIHVWRFSDGSQPVPVGTSTTVAGQHQIVGPNGNPVISPNSTAEGLYGKALYETRNQSTHGYTDNAFPSLATAEPLSVTYYDDYNYNGDPQNNPDVNFKTGSNSYYPTDVAFRRLKGKLTGTKVKVLDQGNNWLFTSMFYDDRGRVIQTRGDNHLGGEDITSTVYDFAGKVLKSIRWHQKQAGQSYTWTQSRYIYDHAGRVLKNFHRIKGQAEIMLSESTYDEVNQLVEKKLHSTKVSGIGYVNFLQNVDYQYNMKGWLTDINSVNFGGLTPTQLAGELGKGLVNQIENQNIEVRLNLAEINNGTYSEIKVEDESKYTEGSTIQTETREEERDIAQDEVLTSNALTNSIDLSRMGDVVNASNIEQALEDIKTDLQTELINLGVTDVTARELVEREVETFYRNTWGATLANDDDNDLYAQHFNYNHFTAANPQYNGNIANSTWRVRGKDKQHYEYTYDDMNRLRSATYHAVNASNQNYNTGGYDMAATYDLNGNINTMWRKGSTAENNLGFATAFGVIDNMIYSYANNSNTLLKVSDSGLNTDGFKDGTNTGNDYTYDANGNLKTDANKNITNITYNHLNLPNVITFANGNTITWLYDAAGVKLQKQIFEATLSTTNTHDYIGGIEYQDNVLEAIYTDEGRAKPYGTTYRYEYTIKDHLGNSRVMFCDVDNDGIVTESEIIQEDHYYPFGLKHEGYGRNVTQGENFYQYNGKELNVDFGLDMYDYGARFYDASVGRWFAVDPLAEKYVGFSPYNYVVNNPLIYIDPNGMYITGDEERVNELENYSTTQLSISDEELKKMGLDKKLIKKFRSVHQNTIDEIKELRNSDVEYHIGKLEANQSNTTGGTGYNHKLNRVEVNVLGSDKATFAHEMKHAYQFEIGEIAFEVDVDRKSGKVNSQSDYAAPSFVYDIYDEVDGYAREQTFYSYNGMAKQLGKTEEERKDWFMHNHYNHPGYYRLLRGKKERVGIYTKMKDMSWGPKGGGAKRVVDYMRMANQDPNFNGKRYFFNDKKSK